jgi:hypothetical protein
MSNVRQVTIGTRPPQAVVVNSDYQCDVEDQLIDVETAGVLVTLPDNPTVGGTLLEFSGPVAFNLSGGQNPLSTDPQAVAAGVTFFAIFTAEGWLLSAVVEGGLPPALTDQAYYISMATGNDQNPGTLAQPVATFQGGVLAKWLTRTPDIEGNVQIFYLDTPSPTDFIAIDPIVGPFFLLTIDCVMANFVSATTTVASFRAAAPGASGQSTQWEISAALDLSPYTQEGVMLYDVNQDVWMQLESADEGTGHFTVSTPLKSYVPGDANVYPEMTQGAFLRPAPGDTLLVVQWPVVSVSHISNKSGQTPQGVCLRHLNIFNNTDSATLDLDGSIVLAECNVEQSLSGSADVTLINCTLASGGGPSSCHSLTMVGGLVVGSASSAPGPGTILIAAESELTAAVILGSGSTQVTFSGAGPLVLNGAFSESLLTLVGLPAQLNVAGYDHGYAFQGQLWGVSVELDNCANLRLYQAVSFTSHMPVSAITLDSLSSAMALDASANPAVWHPGRNITYASLDGTIAGGGFNYGSAGHPAVYALGASGSVLTISAASA